MGLDTVELVMRCEEVFAIDLPDNELTWVIRVGDLYDLICRKMKLEPVKSPTNATGISKLPKGVLKITPVVWNAEDVWATMVAVFVDQLCLEPDQVTYVARIGEDLRVD
jgi:hypothetical protein